MVKFHLASAIGLLLLSSCTSHRDQRVAELTMLADSIQAHQRLLEKPSDASTAEAATWAESNLREFELLLDDGNVVVSKEEGRIISDVSRARRLLKDQMSRRTSLPKSAARAMGQLRGLAQVITSGASTDAAGSPIDSAYIAREMKTELAIGRDVVSALEETQELAERGIAIWHKTADSADSLQTVCRSRLAKAIIESE